MRTLPNLLISGYDGVFGQIWHLCKRRRHCANPVTFPTAEDKGSCCSSKRHGAAAAAGGRETEGRTDPSDERDDSDPKKSER